MKQPLSKQGIPFTQIANAVLEDARLSWKAKGLFCYLYSRPDSWDFNGDRITRVGKDKRDAVFSALRELEEAGYLHRERQKNGRMKYYISYEPVAENPQEAQKPVAENPQEGKSPRGKIRNISNTELINNTEEESNIERHSQKKNLTPGEIARALFDDTDPKHQLVYEHVLGWLVEHKAPLDFATAELAKFIAYWTELTKSGKKQRWELQPVFQLNRRLATWFANNRQKAGNQYQGKNYDHE